MTTEAFLICPYCEEEISVIVDCSVPRQTYTEDCSVCCRPVVLEVQCTGDEFVSVRGSRENG